MFVGPMPKGLPVKPLGASIFDLLGFFGDAWVCCETPPGAGGHSGSKWIFHLSLTNKVLTFVVSPKPGCPQGGWARWPVVVGV